MFFQFILLFTTLILFRIFKRRLESSKNLPPGPFRWPIIGSLPQMLMQDSTYTYLQLTRLAEKYGPIMSFGFGVHSAVVVSDYEILKDIFRRPETTIERFRFEYFEQRNNFKNLGLIWSYGQVWKEQRKYCMKLLRQFGFGKKQTMDETIQAEVNDLVADIQKEVESTDGVWKVELNRLAACAINIVWASVGGYRFDPHSTKIKRHLDLSNDIFESLGPKNMLGAFPFLKVFPSLSGFRKHYEIGKECREFMLELIEDAKEKRQGRVVPESFVEVYLDEIENNKDNPQSTITADQLILILMDLFLGGSDTTSGIINWILLYLGLNPNVQNKVRAEINQFLQAGFIPIPSSALTSMPYLQAIILEAMRHSPFQPMPTPKKVSEDIVYAKYRIPAGTCLFPNYYPVFHDKAFWGDPEVYRPERMLLPSGDLDPTKTERIVQFGIGGRICPAENMAMTSVSMIVAALVRNFEFEVVPGKEPKIEPATSSLIMKPKPFVLKTRKLLP